MNTTDPEARKILMDFVRKQHRRGRSQQEVEDNFSLCLGMESPLEADAYFQVSKSYFHIVTWVYTFR